MTEARDRILDAYEDLLAAEGERFATLDAVAERADVSKGGLLYHFPSKDRLALALFERLLVLAAADVEQMRTSPEGPARYYVRTSQYVGTPLDRALVAVARLQQSGDPRAKAAIESIAGDWLCVLNEALGDLDAARAVKLIGDGLYYNALFDALGGERRPVEADSGLLAIIDRITGTV